MKFSKQSKLDHRGGFGVLSHRLVRKVLSEKIAFFFFFWLFAVSRAAPVAYGWFQARGLIGAVAAGLCQSHSNEGSEPPLKPTPQLTATLDP